MDDMTEFRVTYDGAALANHEMDPRELAPALLAMAELLECASRVLYGEKARLRVNVKGSFQTGSFNIDFVAAVHWVKTVRDIFAGDSAAAIANASAILGLLGFASRKGLAHVLLWLNGRQITRVELESDADHAPGARIFVGDDCIHVERDTVDLLRDAAVRKAFDQVLAPLDRDGIDTFVVGTGSTFNLAVYKESRSAFASPPFEEELITDHTLSIAYSIVSLAFKGDNKWRLSDGSSTISATISDEVFRENVNSSLATFSKGDLLICTVRIRQWQTLSGARTEYDVIKVDEHRHGPRQIGIPGLGSATHASFDR